MIGISFNKTQTSGVVTSFATVIDIRWQPFKSANVQVGYFIDSASFQAGKDPVTLDYAVIDITQIQPTGNIPAQLVAQLIAPGGLLANGTPV